MCLEGQHLKKSHPQALRHSVMDGNFVLLD